jgi:hypothetical protein
LNDKGYTLPLPQDSAGDIYSSALTQGELAEISTRKMRAALPPEATRWSKHEMAEMATHKVSAVLSPLPDVEKSAVLAPVLNKPAHPLRAMGGRWYSALKKILPVYVAIHLGMLAISALSFLYVNHDFASIRMPVATLWTQWRHWDTGYYVQIALHGYIIKRYMAFFPLYPLLERAGMALIGDPYVSGLIISNLAQLVMFTVLYRLLERDFGVERAFHSVLYFALFPTAFFFSIGYTEATFLCFSTLTFYQLRRERWSLAALCGFLACLTRPDGMFLAIPFCYEYLSRKWPAGVTSLRVFLQPKHIFTLIKSIRFNILLCLCIPAGILCFMVYGRYQYGDFLAFFHAHDAWGRFMAVPGYGMFKAAWAMYNHGLLSFTTLRTAIDLGTDLLVGILLFLCFIGKWRLPPRLWSYGLYALAIYLYLQTFVKSGVFPLESMSRFLLEIFPAFLILAHMRKNRLVHLSYLVLALVLFFFLATQYATGHWVL